MSSYLTISHGAGAAPFVLPSNSTAGQCLISRGGHIALSFPPLYGGGLLVALAQVAVVYYAVAAVLHCVVPRLLRPPSIQPAPRRAGQAWREARNSIGVAPSIRCIRHYLSLNLIEVLFLNTH